MAKTAVIRNSNGTVSLSGVEPVTARNLVRQGHATITVGKKADFLDVTLVSTSKDTQFGAAAPAARINLGLDDIRQVPHFFPEVF